MNAGSIVQLGPDSWSITLEERIAATERALLAACRELNVATSGDLRIAETDAARLLCVAAGTLKAWRSTGEGPAFFRTPLNGCRVSYALRDLSSWIEVGRDDRR